MRWLAVALAAAAGLLQAAGAGWWGSLPPISLPALAVALQLPGGNRRRLLAVALASGLAWDAATGAVGAGTLAMLAAAAAGELVAQRWLPPHGATAVAALAGGIALVARLALFVAAGFTGAGVLAWLGESIGTGLAAAAIYAVTYRRHVR